MLRRQLTTAEERMKDYNEVKEQKIRLEIEKDAEKRRADELSDKLKEAQDKLESLFREVGKSYHEGYIAGLKDNKDE